MNNRIFLSILGTGFYEKCRYAFDDFVSTEVRYIQTATLGMLSHQKIWNAETDHILIFATEKAISSNWKSIGERAHPRTNVPESYDGLYEELEKAGLTEKVSVCKIPEGNNEEEIWQIFTTIYNEIHEGDKLHLDITHSLRYMPMLLLVLCNYAKFLKHIQVEGITYGNFFAQDEHKNKMINDLLPLVTLQEWTSAAQDFVDNGRTEKLKEHCQNSIGKLFKTETGKEHISETKAIRSLTNDLDDFVQAMQLCKGRELATGKIFQEIKNNDIDETSSLIPPLMPILKTIKETLSPFHGTADTRNLIIGARWCMDHHLFQQGVTLLQEGIVSYYCQVLNLEKFNIEDRKLVMSILIIMGNDYEEQPEKWKVKEEDKCKIETILTKQIIPSGLAKRFTTLTEKRNTLNHAGMNCKDDKNSTNADVKINKLIKSLDEITKYINFEEVADEHRPKVLINLSNHPSSNWSAQQLKAAEVYGEIIDLDFPTISSTANEEDIEEKVEQYTMKILNYQKEYDVTVHAMGEMTFTFALVARLKSFNIPCIASCSERIAEEANGRRISVFQFERFRNY